MSFILDALKKSELERKRQSVPGLVDAGTVRQRPRLPAWAIALAVLLAVNLLVLLFVLTRSFLSSPPAQAAVQTPRGASPVGDSAGGNPGGSGNASGGAGTDAAENSAGAVAPAAASRFSPLDAPVYAPEIPVAAAPPATAPIPATAIARPSNADGPVSNKAHRRDPLLTDEDFKTNDDEVLPTINEVTLTGAQALPELHLDVHVFATKPAERFVYVNMRKYHEGATLQEGPLIERIRRDGVVLSYQGLRFLLPRQ